jgi:hypothetical protein
MRRALMVAAAAAALVVGVAPLAAAEPPERETVLLDCDNGQTYTALVNGNGAFTSARVVDSIQVAVPVTFSDRTFTAVLPDGTVIEDSDPSVESKGGGNVQARNPQVTLRCTFELTTVVEEGDDAPFPVGTEVTFSGVVTGFVPGP